MSIIRFSKFDQYLSLSWSVSIFFLVFKEILSFMHAWLSGHNNMVWNAFPASSPWPHIPNRLFFSNLKAFLMVFLLMFQTRTIPNCSSPAETLLQLNPFSMLAQSHSRSLLLSLSLLFFSHFKTHLLFSNYVGNSLKS